MKIKAFLIGLMALCLSACVSSPARDDAPATDLEVLRLGVHAMTEPREPEGPVSRPEDAETNEQAWGLLLALDDIKWLSNQDKLRLRTFVDGALDAIAASRLEPCRWWDWRCRRDRAKPRGQAPP